MKANVLYIYSPGNLATPIYCSTHSNAAAFLSHPRNEMKESPSQPQAMK
jgi:hypothetical protein